MNSLLAPIKTHFPILNFTIRMRICTLPYDKPKKHPPKNKFRWVLFSLCVDGFEPPIGLFGCEQITCLCLKVRNVFGTSVIERISE